MIICIEDLEQLRAGWASGASAGAAAQKRSGRFLGFQFEDLPPNYHCIVY